MILAVLLCFQDKVEVKEHGSHYLLHKPPAYADTRSWPVILDLHGEKEDAARAVTAWEMTADAKGYFVVAPQGRSGAWEPKEHAFILACLNDAKTKQRIDPERVLLTGFSGGGDLAADLSASHRRLFGACAPFMARSAGPPDRKRPPFYVVIGGKDELRGKGREAASELASGGVDVIAREVPGVGHARPGRDEYGRVLDWFESKVRPRASLDAAEDFIEQGRYLDASLALAALMERPDQERVARMKLQRVEAAGLVALGSVQVAWANRKYKDAFLRCRDAATQFSWLPAGEKIRKRLAELESDERVKRALQEDD